MSVRAGCESNVGTATFIPMEQMMGSGIISPSSGSSSNADTAMRGMSMDCGVRR